MSLNNAMLSYINYNLNDYRNSLFPNCDLLCYYGGIEFGSLDIWNNQLEALTQHQKPDADTLVIVLSTGGGSVEIVEKLVETTRRFYEKVYFVIPDFAMSAGTIWAMSGNKIYMSYLSSLGPIDPQVQSADGKWVPALGYLDKFNEIVDKSQNDTVSQVELMMVGQLDLANLRRYEQAVELSIELLKKWLTKYKFSDWDKTQDKGKKVTNKQKMKRAEEIATLLSDNKKWHSHGRFISIETLQNDVQLKIDDYTNNIDMLKKTDQLHQLLRDYQNKMGLNKLVFIAEPFKKQ